VSGQHDGVVGQGVEALLNALGEGLEIASGQVGAAYASLEEHIAGEEEGLFAGVESGDGGRKISGLFIGRFGEEEGYLTRGVAGREKHLHAGLAEEQLVAIAEVAVGIGGVGLGCGQAIVGGDLWGGI